MKKLLKTLLPESVYRPILWHWRRYLINRGCLRRLQPFSRAFGVDRGLSIDRHYIEGFLHEHRALIRGRTLEIGDDAYTKRFGGNQVLSAEVLHAVEGNPQATLVGDLSTGRGLACETFDCIVLTQALHVIYDVQGALKNVHSLLRPGGAVLATAPGISQISRYDMDRWGDYWRFTTASAARIFCDVFGKENVTVRSHGNVMAAVAFLHGLAAQELTQEELIFHDPDYELLITVVATRCE